jgi:Domain of unknown function (DUF6321)
VLGKLYFKKLKIIMAKYKTAAWSRKEGKDAKGGLNAKGVASYRKANPGSKLKMGVNKTPVTVEEKRRQGSFLTRFYGETPLPPLKKPNGEPTRLALANNRWNGTTVKTVEQARSLYAKGKRLLEQSKKMKKK